MKDDCIKSTMAEQESLLSLPSSSVHGQSSGANTSRNHIGRLLVICCIVIFCMMEERAYYAEDFRRPVFAHIEDISHPPEALPYDINSENKLTNLSHLNDITDKSLPVEDSSDGDTNNDKTHIKLNQTAAVNCREATVKGNNINILVTLDPIQLVKR